MCIGLPGRVVESDGLVATVDCFGTRRKVGLGMLDEPVGPGDYVLCYAGSAIRCIPPDEVTEMLALYDRLIEQADRDDETIADGFARVPRASRDLG